MDRDENIIIFGEDVCGGTGVSVLSDSCGGSFFFRYFILVDRSSIEL